MAEGATYSGLEHHVTKSMLERSSTAEIETRMGRKLSSAPTQLKQILYVPDHNNDVTHLPLYNVTEAYNKTVGGWPVGSSRFKTSLSLMQKPVGDGRDAEVMYLVDFLQGATVTATVNKRTLGHANAEATLSLPAGPCEDYSIGTSSGAVPVSITFPIPDTVVKGATVRNPYFSFTYPTLIDATDLQWQVHPKEHGSLRYSLIEVNPTSPTSPTEDESIIRAIYHHIGLGLSLSQPYSEGVLLIPEQQDPETEAVIIASLIGLLWEMRSMETKARNNSLKQKQLPTGGSKDNNKKSFFGKMFGKK